MAFANVTVVGLNTSKIARPSTGDLTAMQSCRPPCTAEWGQLWVYDLFVSALADPLGTSFDQGLSTGNVLI